MRRTVDVEVRSMCAFGWEISRMTYLQIEEGLLESWHDGLEWWIWSWKVAECFCVGIAMTIDRIWADVLWMEIYLALRTWIFLHMCDDCGGARLNLRLLSHHTLDTRPSLLCMNLNPSIHEKVSKVHGWYCISFSNIIQLNLIALISIYLPKSFYQNASKTKT